MAFYSSGVEYGIHSLMCMVDSKGDARDMSVREIADLQSVPYDYLAKIFTRLSKPVWCAALRVRAAVSSWRNPLNT
jgi:DNA-binding IscR family transcriptional regulator